MFRRAACRTESPIEVSDEPAAHFPQTRWPPLPAGRRGQRRARKDRQPAQDRTANYAWSRQKRGLKFNNCRHRAKSNGISRKFELSDLDGNFLVIAATDSPQVNAAVYQGCVERNIICNSVDDIPNCDFYFGSVVSRGDLQIAISTAGESPAFAQRLRREIDEQLPEDLGSWLENLGQLRREVLEMHPRSEARKALLHQLAQRPVCESAILPIAPNGFRAARQR